VRDRLLDRLRTDPGVRERLPELEHEVRTGNLTPSLAAQTILDLLGQSPAQESS
jgi:LAO/AO transport system kinase